MRGVTGHDKHHSMDVLSLFAISSATCRRVRACARFFCTRILSRGRTQAWALGRPVAARTRLFLFFKKGARQAAHCRP